MRAIALFCVIMSLFTLPLSGQSRFSVDDTMRLVSGGTSWGVLHHFIQANNHTGDTLQMRWRKTVKANPPSAWQVNFADPESNHPNIAGIDSADFIFPDSASNHTYNKFVIGVKPNGATGTGQYIFTIFEKQFPADSIRIYYNVEVYTSFSIRESDLLPGVYPIPAHDFLYLPVLPPGAEVSLHSLAGRELKPTLARGAPAKLDLAEIPAGVYFLQCRKGREVQIIKISIVH